LRFYYFLEVVNLFFNDELVYGAGAGNGSTLYTILEN
jgi:hypothetical protein